MRSVVGPRVPLWVSAEVIPIGEYGIAFEDIFNFDGTGYAMGSNA